jgi:hypothetical protein
MIGSSQDLNMKRTWRRWQPSSYFYGPVVQGRLLTYHSGGRHGDEEGLRRWFSSPAGCREELLDPPDLASMTAAACSMFRRKLIEGLGFPHRGEYIAGGAAQEVGQAASPPGGAGQGLAAPPYGVAGPWSPTSLLWTPSHVGKNRNFGFCFVQFREYFLCSFSETPN